MYKINKGGIEYLSTIDALLVVNLFSQLVHSGADVELEYEGRVFASSKDISLYHGEK